MLEKNEKKCDFLSEINYFDAHFHYFDCINADCFDVFDNYYGCSCAHSEEEWIEQYEISNKFSNIFLAFGMHPQQAGKINIIQQTDFLENLLKNKQIVAIGEMGFDYFNELYKNYKEKQEKIFIIQLELALKYNVPLVIHCRKANEKLFEYSDKLKKVPAVLFHSFMGSVTEANSLLKRGINAFFSFGNQILTNNKRAIQCMSELPLENLLCETDAPFQTLKGMNATFVSDIKSIYQESFRFRNKDSDNFDFFCKCLSNNFQKLFGVK